MRVYRPAPQGGDHLLVAEGNALMRSILGVRRGAFCWPVVTSGANG
jgi:hypothetical protein